MNEKRLFLIVVLLLSITLGARWYVKSIQQTESGAKEDRKENTNIEKLVLRFLDIGQGDATLVDFPNGEQMLIDCSKDARVLAALGRNMKPFDRTIDYLVVTHPDNDHYGGCIDVLDRFTVRHIWYNGVRKTNDSFWNFFWDKVHAEGAEYVLIDQIKTFDISSTTIRIIYPDHNVIEDIRVPGVEKDTGDNNTSIVFRMDYGKTSALFTGDMELPLEQYLVQKASSTLDVDILKVGHHGSNSSSGQSFLARVSPAYSTISAGKENRYGHPTARVLKRLERTGGKVFRTDLSGDITLSLDGVTVQTGLQKDEQT